MKTRKEKPKIDDLAKMARARARNPSVKNIQGMVIATTKKVPVSLPRITIQEQDYTEKEYK